MRCVGFSLHQHGVVRGKGQNGCFGVGASRFMHDTVMYKAKLAYKKSMCLSPALSKPIIPSCYCAIESMSTVP